MDDTATTDEIPLVSVWEICDGEAPDAVVADWAGFFAGAGADVDDAGWAAGLPVCAHAAGAPAVDAAITVPASIRRQRIKKRDRGARVLVIGKSGSLKKG
jgi:hypothetical protein